MIDNLKSIYNDLCKGDFDYFMRKYEENNMYIFARDENGDTLLHYAALSEEFDIAKMLLELGANPMIRNAQDQTPISLAIEAADLKIFRLLLEIKRDN